MELIAILFVIAIWDVSKSAVRNARNGAPSSSPAPARPAPGRAGRSASRGVRQRQAGYWAREAAGGFPAARTGWHAGWLAHKTALAQQRNIREAARTSHVETERDTAASIREHRKRQAEARDEIEAELAAQQAKGSPATGKRAVRQAADEVARKRQERQQPAATCPSCGAPDGYEHLKGCDPAAPPLPADSVRRAGPAVIDTPVRVHNAGDSQWLNPGEPRCEGCGGTGQNDSGNDACPVCRGWGGAAVGPEFMSPAPAGMVCNACGRKGSAADPVLIAPGGTTTHRSHAARQHEAYAEALRQLYPDDGQIDDAVIGADHGFDDEHDTHPSPTTEGAPVSGTANEVADLLLARHRDRLGQSTASPTTEGTPVTAADGGISAVRANPDKHSTHPFVPGPSTNGAPVTDTNYTAVLATARTAAEHAEQDAVAATSRRVAAENHAEGMQAADVKGNCLSAQMELVELHKQQEIAAKKVGEQAQVVSAHLQREHGGIQAAVDDAPIPEPAQPGFYTGR